MKSNNLQQIANSHSRLLPQGTPNDGGIGWWALHSLQIVMDSIAPDRLSASSDKAAKKDQKHWGESVDVERPKGICFSEKFISIVTGVSLAGGSAASAQQTKDDPANWAEYHRGANGWRFSPLDEVNKSNVKKLKVAWLHQPGDITQGLQATPLVIDGVLYYVAANNRVFAVDAATGDQIWSYTTELDPIAQKALFSAYNRGVAVGRGKVFFGSLDGRAIALDQKTGKRSAIPPHQRQPRTVKFFLHHVKVK